jgi:hypothetical protein
MQWARRHYGCLDGVRVLAASLGRRKVRVPCGGHLREYTVQCWSWCIHVHGKLREDDDRKLLLIGYDGERLRVARLLPPQKRLTIQLCAGPRAGRHGVMAQAEVVR